ncbi:MAG: NTP transferase domain-containing protein [Magnetococcales bacterium]|nr:NTP transferase domain-containing protein [Magnetococcales bacterium]
MKSIIDISQVTGTPQAKLWTAIIPAAGRGSRLGYDKPKILYPLLGRTILDWLLDALIPVCDKFILVLAPDGVDEVIPSFKKRVGAAGSWVVQEKPTGMGSAVLLSKSVVETPYSMVIWGDQVTLRKETLLACAAIHEQRPNATMTLPTIIKENPYIHLERDSNSQIKRVLQARENEIKVSHGENDCGLFLFTTSSLFPTLEKARAQGVGMGSQTSEFNLVQVLPKFENGPGSVATVRIHDPMETLGVNSVEDAQLAEQELAKRA